MSSMKDEALSLARKGYAVFPCRPNSKQPLHMGSFHDATVDEFQIVSWWDACPDANIGMYPAAGYMGDLLIVDADIKKDVDGRDAITYAPDTYPPTLIVSTPSGGEHHYYGLPEGVKVQSSAGRLGDGLDVRSHGGYVLMPPSVVDGKPYEWVNPDCDITDAPEHLIEMAGEQMSRHPDADKWLCEEDLEVNVKKAREWLKGQVVADRVAVSGQGGNNFTYATAEVLRDFGLSAHETAERLFYDWNPSCQPPWSMNEITEIVCNAYEYANRPAGTRVVATPASLDMMQVKAAVDAMEAANQKPSELLKWEDIMNMPDPTYIVDQAIPENGLVMIYGPYGAHKTFVAIDLLMAVAAGKPWMGLEVTEPGEVVYATPEGVSGFKWRVMAWAKTHSGWPEREAPALMRHVNFLPRMPMFGDLEQVQGLHDLLRGMKPKIIVLDTMAHAMAGMDENAQKDAGLFIARVMMLKRELGCTVVLIHHTGKDETRGARGASGIPAACDTVFEVTNPAANVVQVEMKKQKDGERWRKSKFYNVVRGEHSLALEYDATPPVTDRTIIHDQYTDALKLVLLTENINPPLGNTKLAKEMANLLWHGEGSPGPDLQKAVANWLTRTAGKSPELAPWVHAKTKGGAVSLWAPPKKDDEGS